MFFTGLPDMPENMSDEQKAQANNWLAEQMSSELWSATDVCRIYNYTQPRLSQILSKYVIEGHIMLGNGHYFIVRYAKRWFDAKQVARNKRAAKAEQTKAKRVYKKKDADWRDFEFQGQPARVPDEFPSRAHYYRHIRSECMKAGEGKSADLIKSYNAYREELKIALGISQ